jgi:hypothetical protein
MLRCRQEYMQADYLPAPVRDDIASLMLALQESQVALQDSQERVNRAIDVADALRRAIAEAKQQMNEDW